MPGSVKCQPGCGCKKHSRNLGLSTVERKQRHRDQSREAMRLWRERNNDPCPSCGQPKTPGYEVCDTCRRAAQRALATSPEERRRRSAEYMRQRRLADPERARTEAREQYKRTGRKYNLKWKFGMTPELLEEMLQAQGNCCYLCDKPLEKGSTHIDHDHGCCDGNRSCGRCIRGVACQNCNQGIGQFGDDPERMRRVADRLEAANRRLRLKE